MLEVIFDRYLDFVRSNDRIVAEDQDIKLKPNRGC
jgi:hypothetical protein